MTQEAILESAEAPEVLQRPGCPVPPDYKNAPACATRLRLHEVMEKYLREAVTGTCDTGRYRCPYYSWGKGPPLVFVPGLCDDRLSFVLVIARLQEHFRCIAFDLPTGRGDGARLGRYHHADFVADLFALLDHLDLGQTALFGSSLGSTISLRAMHDQPARFTSALFQGGFARRPLARAEVLLASVGRYLPGSMAALPLRERILKFSQGAPFLEREADAWHFFLQRNGAPPMAAVAHRALILHRLDLRPLLPRIRHPVLLVCGDRDPLVGKQCEQELLEGLPCVAHAEIENCGHLPQFTHPEVLAELTLQYLRQIAARHWQTG